MAPTQRYDSTPITHLSAQVIFLSVFLLFESFECDTIRHFHITGKFKDTKPIARSASINDHSTACYARAVRNIDGH